MNRVDKLGDLSLTQEQVEEFLTYMPLIDTVSRRYVKYLNWSYISKDDFVQELSIQVVYVIKTGKLAEAQNKGAFVNTVVHRQAVNVVNKFRYEDSRIYDCVESSALAEPEYLTHYKQQDIGKFLRARYTNTNRLSIEKRNADSEHAALNRLYINELLALVPKCSADGDLNDTIKLLVHSFGLFGEEQLEVIDMPGVITNRTKEWLWWTRNKLLKSLRKRYNNMTRDSIEGLEWTSRKQ